MCNLLNGERKLVCWMYLRFKSIIFSGRQYQRKNFLLYNKPQRYLRQSCCKKKLQRFKSVRGTNLQKKSKLPYNKVSKSWTHMFFLNKDMESLKRTIKWESCEILINTGFNAIINGSVILHLTISICNKLLPSLSFVFLFYLFIFYFDSFEKYKYRYLSTTDTHIFWSSL